MYFRFKGNSFLFYSSYILFIPDSKGNDLIEKNKRLIDENLSFSEINKILSTEFESWQKHLMQKENQALSELEDFKRANQAKISELEENNKALKEIIAGNHQQIDNLIEERNKILNENMSPDKKNEEIDKPEKNYQEMDKNFEKQRQEKMKKIEESNKVLENKVRVLNGEIEKYAKNQKENEKRAQDKNNYIKEILQVKWLRLNKTDLNSFRS